LWRSLWVHQWPCPSSRCPQRPPANWPRTSPHSITLRSWPDPPSWGAVPTAAERPMWERCMRTLLMVVFVSLFSGTVAFSQEPRTQLRVVVRSEGQPVAGATVVAGARSGQTDADGVAQLDAVPGIAT